MRGWGKVVQGIVGHEKDLNAYPTEVGALEGCGERRRPDLIQMFIGNLCGFCGGGQSVGYQRWGRGEGTVTPTCQAEAALASLTVSSIMVVLDHLHIERQRILL